VLVPEALLADGAPQHAVEGFHHREVRAQPAAVQAAVFPREPHAGADHAEDRQAAAQDDVERRLGGVDAPGEEVVQPQRPVHAEEEEVLEVEVETEQVEHRRQHEQDEEAGLEPQSLLLGVLHGANAKNLPQRTQRYAREIKT
jgi:hypothetical protein